MPEMLRIDEEVNCLITSIQLSCRLRNGYRTSKIDVVRRALHDMAEKMDIPQLEQDLGQDEENDEAGR